MKELGALWKAADEATKEKFSKLAEQDKKRYDEEMKRFACTVEGKGRVSTSSPQLRASSGVCSGEEEACAQEEEGRQEGQEGGGRRGGG